MAVSNGLYATCYNSRGWCEAECSLPCYYINHCNGFPFMFACPSTLFLFLFILVCIIVLGLVICCTTICCCKCYAAKKGTKNSGKIHQREPTFGKNTIQPVQFHNTDINHHISLNAFDDFPSTQVNVTPAPRVSIDSSSSSEWQMNFSKPNGMSEETNFAKKTFALRYK
uniref:Uncharacterized protein n=1 Tax=Plectus sambesii TaxID=2011161 RepID=A0A914W3I2_9BILA